MNPTLAATMAAETMAVGGKSVSSDVTKLRQDVLKQAIASLASFIGGVNYSDSFHMAAKAAGSAPPTWPASPPGDASSPPGDAKEPEPEGSSLENPLYDTKRMGTAMEHANEVTKAYGVRIVSINILSA